MKRLNIWLCSMLLCITACEKDLPVFEIRIVCWILIMVASSVRKRSLRWCETGAFFQTENTGRTIERYGMVRCGYYGKTFSGRPSAGLAASDGGRNEECRCRYALYSIWRSGTGGVYVVPAHSATAHIPWSWNVILLWQKGMSFCESLLEKMQISKQAIRNFLLIRWRFPTVCLNRMPGIWRLWIIISENMGRKSMNWWWNGRKKVGMTNISTVFSQIYTDSELYHRKIQLH